MHWLAAAVIGAAGGASMEAIDVIKAVKWHKKMPWDVRPDSVDPPRHRPELRPGEEELPAPGWKAYCVAGVLRLLVSGTLTGVVTAAYPHRMNALVAYLVGLGSLAIIQQAVSFVPLAVKSIGRAALSGIVEEAPPQQAEPPANTAPAPQEGTTNPGGAG
ncbi:hypothetical protein [Streptomyces sp. NPDC021224]|uniref:hypothetical protein n=1 Tax=unclassified Streptomyces TaxID=2593676 RepID=UPI0037962E54